MIKCLFTSKTKNPQLISKVYYIDTQCYSRAEYVGWKALRRETDDKGYNQLAMRPITVIKK